MIIKVIYKNGFYELMNIKKIKYKKNIVRLYIKNVIDIHEIPLMHIKKIIRERKRKKNDKSSV